MQTVLSDALARLSQDHISFRKLLNTLEREIEAIGQGRYPDFGLLEGVTSYFLEYSGRFHHPVEHLIYGALETSIPEVAAGIKFIEGQHTQIGEELAAFTAAVEDVRTGGEVLRHAFCDAGRKFIDFERRHIRGEENSLFYLAVSRLTAADWLAIDREARRITEPLSNGDLGEHFRRLLADVSAWDFENAQAQLGSKRI